MKKKVFFAVILITVVAAGIGYSYLYKGSRNIEEETPVYSMSTGKIANEYATNAAKCDSLYLNQTLEISGIVTQADDSTATLDAKLFCSFTKQINKNIINKKITITGRCIGYDELIGEVKLDQCTIK